MQQPIFNFLDHLTIVDYIKWAMQGYEIHIKHGHVEAVKQATPDPDYLDRAAELSATYRDVLGQG